MSLTETLRERAALRGRAAQVDCGGLGRLTVEGLPVRELELLLRGADGPRSVFYAACRELQSAGETLRRAGQLYTPEEIMQFVSDGEARLAARTVLELSGWQSGEAADRPSESERSDAEHAAPSVPMEGENSNNVYPQDSNNVYPENLNHVYPQDSNNVYPDDGETGEIRLLSVQKTETDHSKVRPEVVQSEPAKIPLSEQNRRGPVQFPQKEFLKNGQDSHESRPKSGPIHNSPESDTKPQGIELFLPEAPQNVVCAFEEAGASAQDADGGTMRLHESTSEFQEGLHEIKSEFGGKSPAVLHESKSEFSEKAGETLHETESELFREQCSKDQTDRQNLHEIKSELRKILHETESELGERFARQLLEGLRRASWVRGGGAL